MEKLSLIGGSTDEKPSTQSFWSRYIDLLEPAVGSNVWIYDLVLIYIHEILLEKVAGPIIAWLYFAVVCFFIGWYRYLVALSPSTRGVRVLPNMAVTKTVLNSLVFAAFFLAPSFRAQSDHASAATMVTTSATAAVVAPSGTESMTYSARPTEPASIDEGANLLPNIYDPSAINAQSACPGYKADNVKRTTTGFTASLSLAGQPCNAYGTDVDFLNLTVEYQASDRLSVRIMPTYLSAQNSSYYVLSEEVVPSPKLGQNAVSTAAANDLAFFWSNEPTFGFSVVRVSNGDVLFSTEGSKLVYENQFIEFVSPLPENYNLYGLGEVIHGLRLGNNLTRTFYASDDGNPVDANIYGMFPIYLDTRYYEVDATTGNQTLVTSNETDVNGDYISYTHGVYNRNAHPTEVLLRPTNVTWRSLGGSIDLYFYAGPKPTDVISSFVKTGAGLPAMQQYFTLGFHQCRWGYQNWTVLQEVVDNYAKFEIPLENIWTDIDYMSFYRDFENDPIRFGYAEGKKFIDGLTANGQHYIPIVDSAIYIPNPDNASDAYAPYTRGAAQGAFLLNPDGSEYIGEVWPGFTVFPDFLGNGTAWWVSEMQAWHNNVNFSGAWIDMSEASSFCIGSCGSKLLSQNPVHPPFSLPGEFGQVIFTYPEGFNVTNATEAASASAGAASQSAAVASASPAATTTQPFLVSTPTPGVRNVVYPPYVINNIQGELSVHAVSPNATHHNGVMEYDVHNLFGHTILNATYLALEAINPGKRPFIIGRSTFVGSGKFAGHWGGDNYASWPSMTFSIPQALGFQAVGIPMFGVDTCGFADDTDEELCNRWMQLSAFFPFYRNHNTLSAIPQEAYTWASVIDATKAAMHIRFNLLPYMYTLFESAHTTGSTVMRALNWEVPNDPSLANADRQFFVGPAILVTPVLLPGATSVQGVFPGSGRGEIYYDWYNRTMISASKGENKTIEAPLGHIPTYIRGGYVLPMQDMAMTTRDARQTPWSVLVALNMEGKATGSLYLDDGESIVPKESLYVDFSATSSSLSASSRGLLTQSEPLRNVTVLGVQSAPGNVTFNGMSVCNSSVNYDAAGKILSFTNLTSIMAESMGSSANSTGAWAVDWTLRW